MPRVIFHLDMDAFYAAIEQRDNPALRGKPVIVGSPPTQRGVVCAASYEARKFGVRSAMPSATAGRLCPNGIFVRPRMDVYQNESREIMRVVAGLGATVEQMSIDEAYADASALCRADDLKSISNEETFLRDTDHRPVRRRCLREQAADIAARLKRRRLGAHTVQVKVRYGDFTTLTRQISVEEPITEAAEIYRLGCFLLAREKLVNRPLRLIGLGVSGLGEATRRQLALPFADAGGTK